MLPAATRRMTRGAQTTGTGLHRASRPSPRRPRPPDRARRSRSRPAESSKKTGVAHPVPVSLAPCRQDRRAAATRGLGGARSRARGRAHRWSRRRSRRKDERVQDEAVAHCASLGAAHLHNACEARRASALACCGVLPATGGGLDVARETGRQPRGGASGRRLTGAARSWWSARLSQSTFHTLRWFHVAGELHTRRVCNSLVVARGGTASVSANSRTMKPPEGELGKWGSLAATAGRGRPASPFTKPCEAPLKD